jgi:hypothetical protein
MNNQNIENKVIKEINKASIKYKRNGISLWSIQIMKKMIEDANNYDDDVISFLQEYLIKYNIQ